MEEKTTEMSMPGSLKWEMGIFIREWRNFLWMVQLEIGKTVLGGLITLFTIAGKFLQRKEA